MDLGLNEPSEQTNHSAVVAHIGQRIVGGEFAPGSILPREEEFVEQLAVGRGVVREALKVLASKGMIEPRRRRGTKVLPEGGWQHLDTDLLAWRMSDGPSGRFLRDLVDLRAMIEPAASGHAAQRATPTELELIGALARELERTEHDEDAFIEADMRFHRAILQAAHNDVLLQVGSAIESGLRLSREITVSKGHIARVKEHLEVADAVLARSTARSTRAMAKLIDLGSRDIEAVLGRSWRDENESD